MFLLTKMSIVNYCYHKTVLELFISFTMLSHFSVMDLNDNNKSEVKVNTISEDNEYEYQQTQLEKSSDIKSARVKKLSMILNNGDAREEFYMKRERSKSLDPTQKVDFNYVRSRVSSIMSLGDMGGDAIVSEIRERNGKL